MDMPSDITFSEAIELVKKVQSTCKGRCCHNCIFDTEAFECLPMKIPSEYTLRDFWVKLSAVKSIIKTGGDVNEK